MLVFPQVSRGLAAPFAFVLLAAYCPHIATTFISRALPFFLLSNSVRVWIPMDAGLWTWQVFGKTDVDGNNVVVKIVKSSTDGNDFYHCS